MIFSRQIFVAFTFGNILHLLGSAYASICLSADENRATQIECLFEIKNLVSNRTAFWFGTSYRSNCNLDPVELEKNIECYNPLPLQIDSIETRLFPNRYYSLLTSVDRLLNVTFTASNNGTYEACGKTYQGQAKSDFTVDPLSEEMFFPWQVRNFPEMTWKTNGNERYTVIIFDPGLRKSVAIIINIPGNNLSEGEVFQRYTGMINPTTKWTPFLFLVHRQTTPKITPDISLIQNGAFDLEQFLSRNAILGPSAMSVIRIRGDPYAVQKALDVGMANNCPALITEALKRQNEPFLPEYIDLTVFINVTFHSPPITFQSCCRRYSYREKTFALNPLDDMAVYPAEARSDNRPDVQLMMKTMNPNYQKDFIGKMYTLLMIDPDVPLPEFGTEDRPLIHWLIVNIPEHRIHDGQIVKDYLGPAPPDPNYHHYYYLLYEQTTDVERDSFLRFVERCSFEDRCLFNVTGYISYNNMKLVGATWMKATSDVYARFFYTNVMGMQEHEVCKGILGYYPKCIRPTTRAPQPVTFRTNAPVVPIRREPQKDPNAGCYERPSGFYLLLFVILCFMA